MRRLRERGCNEILTLRGLSARTIDSYLRCVRKFAETSVARRARWSGRKFVASCFTCVNQGRASTFNVYAEQSVFCTG